MKKSCKILPRVLSKITGQVRRLMDHPLIGAPLSSVMDVESESRFLVCGNYTAFYRYENETVYDIRALYGRRDFMKILFGDLPENEAEI